MRINKIVLAATVFGFAASSALAMENIEKLTNKNSRTRVFLQIDTLRYLGTAQSLKNNVTYLKLPSKLEKNGYFRTKLEIEEALAENNFVSCDFSSLRPGMEGIVCGTTDQQQCSYAEQFLRAKKPSRRSFNYYRKSYDDDYYCDCNGCNPHPENSKNNHTCGGY